MSKKTILSILGAVFSIGGIVISTLQSKQDREELKQEILEELRAENESVEE